MARGPQRTRKKEVNDQEKRIAYLCERYSKVDNSEILELVAFARERLQQRVDLETVGIIGRESHYRWQAVEAQRKALEEQYVRDMEGLALCTREERAHAEEEKARADGLSAALAAMLAEVAPTGTTGSAAVRKARELLKGVA